MGRRRAVISRAIVAGYRDSVVRVPDLVACAGGRINRAVVAASAARMAVLQQRRWSRRGGIVTSALFYLSTAPGVRRSTRAKSIICMSGSRTEIAQKVAIPGERDNAAARHAGLAVNLAGSMAVFLVETWRSRVSFQKSLHRKRMRWRRCEPREGICRHPRLSNTALHLS
jgi:hypothetical protein